MNKFKNIQISIKISQIMLFVIATFYLLESIFIRGLFTNVYLLLATIIVGIIAIILSI